MAIKNTKQRSKLPHLAAGIAITLAFGSLLAVLLNGKDVALLHPKGLIANEQSWLLVASTLIMLAFAVPIILTIYFLAWKYRDTAQRSDDDTETKNHNAFLLFAWGGPLAVVIILAALMLPATQRLEPQRAIAAENDQLTVQVVALNWKWLFLYPEQNVASVNFAQIPVDTPVRFELTADGAPMSSFWIPHLGGMLYTMTGHVNPLNLIADTVGDYPGSSAEINGAGFAGMKFTTRVSTKDEFDTWIEETQRSPLTLDEAEYKKLREPSENNKPAFYADPDPTLFNKIIGKYSSSHQHSSQEERHGSY